MKVGDSQVLSTSDLSLKDSIFVTVMITSSITKGWHMQEAIYCIIWMNSKKTWLQDCGKNMAYEIFDSK